MAQLLNQAVAVIGYENKLAAVDKLQTFLSEKMEIDNEFEGFFSEFKDILKKEHSEELTTTSKGSKGKGSKAVVGAAASVKVKKAPSAYNIFIKDKIAEFKAQNPGVKNGKELLKMATDAWKASKTANV